MRNHLASALFRLATWLTSKSVPAGLSGPAWTGAGFVDAFRRQRVPTPHDLLAELKSTAFTCASINAAVCASFPPRLYVATAAGQPRPRCLTRALTRAAERSLRHRPSLPPHVGHADGIEEVLEHPLLTLFRQVNPVHNSFDLWELTTLYQETHGSAYWYVPRGPFGAPEEPLAFLTSDTNLANLQAADHQHLAKAIAPRLRRRDDKLNEQLVPLFDPTGRLFLASEDPVPVNHELDMKQQEIDMKYGVLTVNEVRRERGLPPVSWGDGVRSQGSGIRNQESV